MADLNALAGLEAIQSYAELATNHGYQIRPEFFYDKQLQDTIRLDKSHFVHYRIADVRPMKNKAQKLQIRRWAPLQAHTTPLPEGIPPQSDKGSMESYTIDTYAYGRYMEFTDRTDFETLDPVIMHYTQEYSIVAMETLDLLAREALLLAAQPYFANGKANFAGLTLGDKATLTDFRFITLVMKKQLVKPRKNGNWQVIGTPDFYYDMVSDPTVEKYMSFNQTTKTMYSNTKLVPLFNLEWYETLHHNDSGEYTDGNGDLNLRVYRFNTDTQTYEYASLDEATYLTSVDGYVKDSRTGFDASYIPGRKVWDIDAYNATIVDGFGDYQELKVHRILVIGKEALIRTSLEGKDKAKMYVKAKGSAGVLDPIDQRQSIGFKIMSVGFGSTRLEAVACLFCVPEHANMG